MSFAKFPKLIDYDAVKQQFDASEPPLTQPIAEVEKPVGLSGSKLRSYAFATLTRREYSKAELIEKLKQYAADPIEVHELVEELARENYQSDRRVAELVLCSQQRRGKGPQRIKLALNNKKLDVDLIQQELKEINWEEQAYQLKVKKFGTTVEKDLKKQAKQIRFLMYRGFEISLVMKVIKREE